MVDEVTKLLKTAAKVMCTVLALLSLALGMAGFDFWLFLKSPGSPNLTIRQVLIKPGMSAAAITRLLTEGGVISDANRFYLLCLVAKADQKIKAGEYAFLPLSTPQKILDQIVSGKAVIQRVTFPEGFRTYEAAKTLSEKGLASEEEIMRLVLDKDFIKSNGLDVSSLEGYLFPETYFFQRTQSEAAMLRMMVRQFWRHLPEGWEQRAAKVGLNLHGIVIMASMVEKEAVLDSERPIIAGVFYNRLRENMPLQSDPTAVYDLSGFSGPITWSHLRRQSPYNTYQKRGLPAGPICNPGAKSIQAVLDPEKVSHRYFVSNHDGSHHFSDTLAEHNQAVARSLQKHKDSGDR
jgi:UPF0755 protein